MMMLAMQISRLVTRPGIAYDISFLLEPSIDLNWTGKMQEMVKLVLCNRTVRGEECDGSRMNTFIDLEEEAKAGLG
jgi:hypothetical protein